ncbi:MAG: bifunctional phosphopantothenoylcysteine decarboxylase/phosphopantothenate--cysteine ligase CoaBC [Synergistaceae bacterium]
MNSWKKSKKILYGVSGGIAAYKSPDILHGWIKAGCDVETILTNAAKSFVSPLALSTLTKKRIWCEEDFLSSEYGWKIPHISLTDWADVFVIAPCTANILNMCVQGDSSTLMGATMLASKKPLVLFPAMNVNMLFNPATQKNINLARSLGHTVVNPDKGMLACGYEGDGRLPSNSVIYEYVWKALCDKKDLIGKKVLITAGPTHEYLDPVRYISNPSSGKMGFALARAAWYRGADVTLITGPVSIAYPVGVNVVPVVSADDMYQACIDYMPNSDIIIKSAAVGDFKPSTFAENKIKRASKDDFSINLMQNRDIAAELGKIKRDDQILVGFAAETENIISNAKSKIVSKNLDYIAVNNVLEKDAGFISDTNEVTFISRNGIMSSIVGSKDDVADSIFDNIASER